MPDSVYFLRMEFDFLKAEEFCYSIDVEGISPEVVILDRDFISMKPKVNEKMKAVFSLFSSLNVQTFMRFKSTALFITNRSQKEPIGYLVSLNKTYSLIPRLEDRYKIIQSNAINGIWSNIKLKEIDLDLPHD